MGERPSRDGEDLHHTATGDLGRRILLARTGRGLARSDVAHRAGVSESYLRYVEDQTSHPSPDTLRALARVLGTTEEDLLGGTQGRAPGRRPPVALSHLRTLDEQECWRLVGDHGVGRIAFPLGRDVVVVPVNYAVERRVVAVRTASTTALAHHVQDPARVSLQVDRLDEAVSGGWSVLLTGTAHLQDVCDQGPVPPGVDPWVRVEPSVLLALSPDAVSGRRITW